MDKKIRLAAVKERTPRLIKALPAVWEHSVRATHHFLSEPEILRIRAYVSQAVGGVAQLVAAENQAGSRWASWAWRTGGWKCCSLHRKPEAAVLAGGCSAAALSSTAFGRSR